LDHIVKERYLPNPPNSAPIVLHICYNMSRN
jgi:hypothetical protein